MVTRQSGAGAQDVPCRLVDAPQQPRHAMQDRHDAHQRDLGRVEQRLQALRLQVPAADPDQLDG